MSSLPTGTLKLADAYVPILQAGQYNIDVDCQISGPDSSISESNTKSQSFRVSGPRFTLDISSIYSCSPSPGSQGIYETHLPDIVISEPYFPWERAISTKYSVPIPWVALIVLSAEDLLPSLTGVDGIQGPDADNVYTLDSAAQIPDLAHPPGVMYPSLTQSMTPDDQISCKLIVIGAGLFNQLFTMVDSNSTMSHSYYCHSRRVNSGAYQIDGLTEKGDFSVIFANRFPKSSVVNYVHLVSLEGYGDIIDSGGAQSNTCLVSLYSWSFVCDPAKNENFHGLMDTLAPTAKTALQLQTTSSNTQIESRLSNGFIPVKYHLRTGEDTMGWYRGPFTPVQLETPLFAGFSGSLSGTSLLVFDPTYGTFDVTYATAWQLGRSLALSSTKFLSAIMEFRQTVQRNVNVQIANQMYQVPPSTAKTQFIQGLSDLFGSIASATNNHFDRSSISQSINLANLTQNLTRSSLSSYWPPTQDSYNALTALTTRSMATDAVNPDPNCAIVLEWLTQIMLFRNIPFHYLIPNEKLLPIETLRFFFVDTSWLNSVIDGGLSPAVHSDQDQFLRQEIKNQLATKSPQPLYGVIVRSVVVADWPGLIVTALIESATGPQNCEPIEVRRLPPNVLMAFFPQPIITCRISQPPEQLRFGVSGENQLVNGDIVYRSISTGNYGQSLDESYPRPWPRTASLVLDTQSLLSGFRGRFGPDLSISDFAIQMIGSAEYQEFNIQNSTVSAPRLTTTTTNSKISNLFGSGPTTTKLQISNFSGSGQISSKSTYSTTLNYTLTGNAGPCYWKLSSSDSQLVCSGVLTENTTSGSLTNNLRPATFRLTIVDSRTNNSDSKLITLSSVTNSYTYS